MSDYIPFDIQLQIIKKLPAKSLVQFRSVSKQWKSLIDSSQFIAAYSSPTHTDQPQRLLVWYQQWFDQYKVNTGEKCVSLVDDETLAPQEVVPRVPVLVKQLHKSRVVGSSHGLWCLCDVYHPSFGINTHTYMAVLWNPCIRKSVGIAVLSELNTVLGFGICPTTNDPTIVKFTSGRSIVPFVAEVFTLSTRKWKVSSTTTLPQKEISVTWCQVVIDRFIYWLAFDTTVATGELILSFYMTTQQFSVLVDLPVSSEQPYINGVAISKVFDSLAVIEYIASPGEQSCNVYMMMDRGNPNSFTQLYIVDTPYKFINVLSFSKRGEPIMEAEDDCKRPAALVLYEPGSKSIKDIGVYGKYGSFFVGPYMETLLLIDQLDSRVYLPST